MIPTSYSALPHVPQIFHQDKFVHAAKLFGYRVIHVPYEPCPLGSSGCPICKGGRVGFHRREPKTGEVVDVIRYARADNQPELLSHRFRTTPVTIEAPIGGVNVTLREGMDFYVDGRLVKWTGARRPDYQKEYRATYSALLESWVHLQHAYGDFGGLKRQSERDKFDRLGNYPQGSILMSINHDNPGYDFMTGDVFVPVDGSVRTVRLLEAGRVSNHSPHRFVHSIERAYAVDVEARQEYDVDVAYNPQTMQFDLQDVEDETKVAVIYRAAPQYVVYLDSGEFRNPMGADHQRLVILSKLETSA